jgi:hypothetical protein
MKSNVRENPGASRLLAALPRFQRKPQMSEVRASSSAPSATNEAVPTLCCLKIEYCQYLQLYPSINCEEYFIIESTVKFITDMGSSAPILARKMHFKNCSRPTAELLQGVNIRTDELVIDGCDKGFLHYNMPKKSERSYGAFSLCDKESLNLAIQKLKITNSEKFKPKYLQSFPSLQELEIDCINSISTRAWCNILGILYKLEKITLSLRENCFHTDLGEALLRDIPHIQYIQIKEVNSLGRALVLLF